MRNCVLQERNAAGLTKYWKLQSAMVCSASERAANPGDAKQDI